MSRDPFDEMKRQNPVTRDQLPGAPMSVADRILARRPRAAWPGWAVAAAAAMSVALVGFGMLWFFNEGSGNGVAEGDTSTTGAVTSTVGDTTTTVADLDFPTAVYFFVDTTGESWAGGPFLMPVERMVDGPDPITGTLQALLDGPTPAEAASVPAISSAVPAGTVIRGVTVGDLVVTVDLSSEFLSGGGTLSMMGRLGQVVYTLTRLDGIDGVRFEIEGVPTTVFGGEGIIVNDPATRADFDGLLPAILIETPVYSDFGTTNPLAARGTANVFEATVSLALVDGDGLIIWEGFTTATCGTGCRGDWEISIPYEVDFPQMGSLIAWESSARDGSQTNVREHPVWLLPADPLSSTTPGSTMATTTTTITVPTECSGSNAAPDLIEQSDLPEAVAAKRAAIFAAATTCDWEMLRSLLGPGFSYSFGIDTDAIGYWQEREAAGEPVMYYLGELLNRSHLVRYVDPDTTHYEWPLAFGGEWTELPQSVIEELRPLYDDEDFAGFAAFGGYLGYRIGILEDGTWVFFLEGD